MIPGQQDLELKHIKFSNVEIYSLMSVFLLYIEIFAIQVYRSRETRPTAISVISRFVPLLNAFSPLLKTSMFSTDPVVLVVDRSSYDHAYRSVSGVAELNETPSFAVQGRLFGSSSHSRQWR